MSIRLFSRSRSDEVLSQTPKIVITDLDVPTNGKHLPLHHSKSLLEIPVSERNENKTKPKGRIITRKGGSYKSFFNEKQKKFLVPPPNTGKFKFRGSLSSSSESLNDESLPIKIQSYIFSNKYKKLKNLLNQNKLLLQTFYNSSHYFLHEAAYYGSTKCISVLINVGFDVHQKDELQWTILHAGILGGNIKCVRYLLQKVKVKVDEINSDGLTELHMAVYLNKLEITKQLIQYGADPLFETEQHETAFQLAISLKRTEILDYFITLPTFLIKS